MNVQSVPLRTPPRKTTTVMVAILTGRERHFWIHPDLLNVCMRMFFWQQEHPGSLFATSTVNGVTPVDAARNQAVKQFLKSNFEWLIQIDNDVVPPQNMLTILDEIEDRKIVGLPCGIQKNTQGELTLALGNKAATENVEHPYESYTGMPAGWARIHVVGTGCFIAHRDVFAAIPYPWFEGRVTNTTYGNEDFNFCEKSHAAGFDVWTHSGFPCAHHKTLDCTQQMILKHGPLVR